MKKFTFIMLFATSLQAHAQSIPNAGFENWILVGGWYENPVGWYTNNTQITIAEVIKDTVPYAGNFAMKLVQYGTGFPPVAYTGMNVNTRPFELNGYIKSNVINNDSGMIEVALWYMGNIVDYGKYVVYNGFNPNWTSFTLSISQNLATADSASIIITGPLVLSSSFSVDDLSFNYANAINEMDGMGVSVFPNPASDFLNIKNPKAAKVILSIYDVSGKLVLVNEFNENNHLIDIKSFSEGFYISEIQSGNEIVRRKIQIIR